MAQRYFATINPGLEEALLAEVRELGGKRASVAEGGVEFDATNPVFYGALQRLRCANRVWLRIDEFRARDAPELYNKTARLDWARLIGAETPVNVRAAAHRSRLIHTERIAGAVNDAIDAALDRERPSEGAPLTVLARLVENRCTLSLDASGELLYRRGWKADAVTAPLRETVAAAVLRLIGWMPTEPLIDPFCGSGTIVIEAAQRARGIAAGRDRPFDLHRWANFREDLWREKLETPGDATPTATATFRGTDIASEAVSAARHNAERAGVAPLCTFEVADAAALDLPPDSPPGWIVTNPPWNLRLADPAHEALGAWVTQAAASLGGWRLALIAPRRWTATGGTRRARFDLGGVPVTLWTFG